MPFSLLLKRCLTPRFCFRILKNTSISQRLRQNLAISIALLSLIQVINVILFPESNSTSSIMNSCLIDLFPFPYKQTLLSCIKVKPSAFRPFICLYDSIIRQSLTHCFCCWVVVWYLAFAIYCWLFILYSFIQVYRYSGKRLL